MDAFILTKDPRIRIIANDLYWNIFISRTIGRTVYPLYRFQLCGWNCLKIPREECKEYNEKGNW